MRLIDAGCTDEQAMAITGIRSASVLKIYKRGADQRRLARQALATQLRAEGEQGLSNLSTRLDNKGKTKRNQTDARSGWWRPRPELNRGARICSPHESAA